jgi:hypothetical protein
MSFPSLEAKLDYACQKMEEAGWQLSRAPAKQGARGWRMIKDGVTHDIYAPDPAALVAEFGGCKDRASALLDQHLCGRALEVAGLSFTWF